MKAGATIETGRLVLRHWRADDIEPFHRLNSDDRVMRFFPFRRDRKQSAEMLERIRRMVADDGFGWAAICRRDDDTTIGFSGLSRIGFETAFTPAVEIGWRLLPEHWRKGYASEAARALLAHGFNDLGLDEIVSFAVQDNHASTGVMRAIGMTAEPELDFDMPGIADDMAHLRRHVFYRMRREDWRARA
ncbi:MAG: GNAT family N-acetyltransferase [Rhizobiaceae bacterium]